MSILELALEARDELDAPKNEKLIVMQGPLSEVIYRALNVVYDKKGDEAEYDTSLESAAQDVVVAQRVMEKWLMDEVNAAPDEYERPDLIIYGVEKRDVDEQNVVELKNILDNKNKDTDIILVTRDYDTLAKVKSTAIINQVQGQTESTNLALVQSLESMVTAYGGRIFHSIRSACDAL